MKCMREKVSVPTMSQDETKESVSTCLPQSHSAYLRASYHRQSVYRHSSLVTSSPSHSRTTKKVPLDLTQAKDLEKNPKVGIYQDLFFPPEGHSNYKGPENVWANRLAATYKDGETGKYKKPTWKDHPQPKDSTNKSYTYYPSANMPPTRFVPVMYHSHAGEEGRDMTIRPMMFSIIPKWHKGTPTNHGLTTNNARLEGMTQSRLYKPLFEARKLCVVAVQGFYEWKTVGVSKKDKKQPYLLFRTQESGTKVADLDEWNKAEWSDTKGWNGPKLTMMAGLYDVWISPQGDRVYSYTIITMGANKTMSWLHDRMPAVLETEAQILGWLNATVETDSKELLSILKPATELQFYPVDPKVGKSACHDTDCMQPMEKKQGAMDKFVKKTKKTDAKEPKREHDDDDEDDDDDDGIFDESDEEDDPTDAEKKPKVEK